MNLAHIKLMASLLHVLCGVQTIGLHKLIAAISTTVDKKTGLVLSMDRTN